MDEFTLASVDFLLNMLFHSKSRNGRHCKVAETSVTLIDKLASQ